MDMEGTPASHGYYMPAEFESHLQCWLGWPVSLFFLLFLRFSHLGSISFFSLSFFFSLVHVIKDLFSKLLNCVRSHFTPNSKIGTFESVDLFDSERWVFWNLLFSACSMMFEIWVLCYSKVANLWTVNIFFLFIYWCVPVV